MLALLADLRRQEGAEFEVVVVDDQSPDDSVEAIRRDFPEVRLFVNERNGGPSVTRNRGIREARGGIIVGFDSDVTLPDTRMLEKVVAAFGEDGGASGLAFRILQPDGVSEDVGRWWHQVPPGSHAERVFSTSYFSGTAYAFRRDAVVDAGLYPEILYMHYEEVELAWRVLDGGGRIDYRPELKVLHHANPVSRRSQVEVFLKPRNQILLAVSCLPWPKALGYVIPRTGFQFCKSCAKGYLPDFVRAMRSAIDLLPRQLDARKPLKRETLARISKLRSGVDPLGEPAGMNDAG